MTINGINLPLFNSGSSLELIQLPSKKGTFDIRFTDGFEANDLSYSTIYSICKTTIRCYKMFVQQ